MDLCLDEGDYEPGDHALHDPSYYFMGGSSLRVSVKLFAENRSRLCQKLCQMNCEVVTDGVVLLQGGVARTLYNTDVEYVFRQDAYFHWAFGVVEPQCYGAIIVKTNRSVLFVPRLPEEYADYMGRLMDLCDYKRKYRVDKVAYVDQMKYILGRVVEKPNAILALHGRNYDSLLCYPELNFEGMEKFKIEKQILLDVINECRVFKSAREIEVIRYACKVASDAHKLVMRQVKPGMLEYQCESVFLYYCYSLGGCRHTSYIPICSSGENSSILHYGQSNLPNYKVIKDGDMCLFDMGCSYYGYASDITCSFPANGTFTDDQKIIYNAVYKASKTVICCIKPGISMVKLHRTANKVLLCHLRRSGLLTGEIKEMMSTSLAAIFQPHGIGHFIGCDVHDVGGYSYENSCRPMEPGLKKLRTTRLLEPGMVICVEPGCYFIPRLLKNALESPELKVFLVADVIERFVNFGGLRIEDVVLVTEDGCEVLSDVPRSIREIEAWMEPTEYQQCVNGLLHANAISNEIND